MGWLGTLTAGLLVLELSCYLTKGDGLASPGLPRPVEFSGLSSTTGLLGGQLPSRGPARPVSLTCAPCTCPLWAWALFSILLAPSRCPTYQLMLTAAPANSSGLGLSPPPHLHCHHLAPLLPLPVNLQQPAHWFLILHSESGTSFAPGAL